ncbi:PGN_0703 family putative restriction endonuclease [Blastococcus sp. SYSU DS0616]
MTYARHERARAIAWKKRTDSLPPEAKLPAPYVGKSGVPNGPAYEFCLPPGHEKLNLLADVRPQALTLFAELGVPWHAGVNGGPSNHLLSSQVQCVNALARMMTDPERIRRAFGDLLDIGHVLEIEPGRHLTFEYIGPTDYFGEAPGRQRVRGSQCTSVDAAFLHVARDGVRELVLVEWKYTESYGARRVDPRKDAVRAARYGPALADTTGPVRGDLLPLDRLFYEPLYQLMRQQLLAHQLEVHGAEGASRVRVLHVLPSANDAYQRSLQRPEHRQLGANVSDVWRVLLRHRDRFTSVDSSLFLDESITLSEYVARYGGKVIKDPAELLAVFEVSDADHLEDLLQFHGNVVLDDHGIELQVGTEGFGLEFPFTAEDLTALADELIAKD